MPLQADSRYDSILSLTPQAAGKLFVSELAKQSPVDISLLKMCLAAGADILAADKNGWTLLHEAAFQGDTALIKWCIGSGLNVNAVASYPHYRHSVLYYAIKKQHPEAERLLREHHAGLCVQDGYSVQKYDSATYEGNFAGEEKNGKGTITYRNGRIYTGDWKMDMRDGQGTFKWPNGEQYTGDFKEDFRTGNGTYAWPNGEKYTGGWLNNKQEGSGVDSFSKNTTTLEKWNKKRKYTYYIKVETLNTYTGTWKNGKRDGYGTIISSNGDKYEGSWKAGEWDGKGTRWWANGDTYTGDFQEGWRTGQGTYRWPNGEVYTGAWLRNQKNGQGVDSLANGDVYVGGFKEGKRYGYGELYCGGHRIMEHMIGCAVYKGNWANGLKNGDGAYYNRKGRLKIRDTFVNGSIPGKPFTVIKTDSSALTQPGFFVFTEPIALADISNGESFRVGIERKVAPLWAISATSGVFFNKAKGWMVKGEIKKYAKKERYPGRKNYIAAEYFYKQDTYHQADSIIGPPHDYMAQYTIYKFITGVRFKFGLVQLLVHGITFDSYAGLGLRYRNAGSTLTPYEYAHINYETDGGFVYPYSSALGKTIRPDITAGVRFGLRHH